MAEALLSSPSSIPSLNGTTAFELLCSCAAATPKPEQVAHIANWSCAEFDWDGFLRLAEHHGVTALVARNLVQHARGLPPEIERALKAAYDANLRRNLWFAAELARIVHHFAKRQLRAIPYKGPTLAQSAYGDLGLRSFCDLDLLISPADFARAKQALAEIGYRPAQELGPAVEQLWLRTGYERAFDSAAGKNLVELQWRLLPYFYAVDRRSAGFQVDDLLARGGRIGVGGALIPCLSAEDSLLVLCLHAAKHLWTRLIWVSDIAQSLRAPGTEMAVVVVRASKLGIARILGMSFWLAEELAGATLDSAALDLIARDPEVPSLGQLYATRMARAATYDFESSDYFRQILKLRERRSDRWRYLWRLVWTPGPGEVAAVALPEILFPLYRAVRIGRLLRKLV
jgi:hypothetical protein